MRVQAWIADCGGVALVRRFPRSVCRFVGYVAMQLTYLPMLVWQVSYSGGAIPVQR